jgi:putative endonuclease
MKKIEYCCSKCKQLLPKTLHYAYIVMCSDTSFYTGYTNNLTKRIEAHNKGKGAKYTKTRLPVTLLYYEAFKSKCIAMQREYAIKQMTRAEKKELMFNGK